MVTREKLTEAVKLTIGIQRGFYLGAVSRDKNIVLGTVLSEMDSEQYMEYINRVIEWKS